MLVDAPWRRLPGGGEAQRRQASKSLSHRDTAKVRHIAAPGDEEPAKRRRQLPEAPCRYRGLESSDPGKDLSL
jgi:hypothetical protein